MAVQILIGGTDMTQYVDLESIRVTNSSAAKSDTMDFELSVPVGATIPRAGNEVLFLNGGDREFAGILMRPEEDLINPATLRYTCQARDWSFFFDRRLVTETYAAQPADQIVSAIVQDYTAGFTANNVQAAFDVAEQTFDDVYPSDAIKQLADTLEWFWYIDYNKDVHFAPLESFVSPLPGNQLNADTDTNTYHDLILREDVAQIKNRIYLKNLKVKNDNALAFRHVGNGTQSWFPLGYEPYDLAGVAVSVNGSPYPIKKEYGDGAPGDGQTSQAAYVCFDNMGCRITPTPANGDVITGTVIPVFGPTKVMIEDPEAQGYMAAREGGDGIHEFVVNDPGLSGPDTRSAEARGQVLLYKYGYPRVTGTFGSYVQGWRAGQYFYLQSNIRMGGMFSTPQRMYVTQVTKRIIKHEPGDVPVLHYQVDIADSPFVF